MNKNIRDILEARERDIVQAAVLLFEEAVERGAAHVTARGSIVFAPDAVSLHSRYYQLSEWLRESSPEHYARLRATINSNWGRGAG